MFRQTYISEGGKMVTRRNWKILRNLAFWIGMQLLWGAVVIAFVLLFHIRRSLWLFPVQEAGAIGIAYFQMRAACLSGMDVIFERDLFEKWDIIKPKPLVSDIRFLVFKKNVTVEGRMVCRVYPFFLTRKDWMMAPYLLWIRILIGVKLIK